MKAVRNILAIGLVAASSMLTGCGGGAPSVEDVQKALLADAKESMAAAQSMGVKIDFNELIKVKGVKNCKEVRDDIYECSVEATAKIFGMEKNTIANIRFMENSEGEWRAVQ